MTKKKRIDGKEQDASDIIKKPVQKITTGENVDGFWNSKKNQNEIIDILKEYGMNEKSISTETKRTLMNLIISRRK